MPARRATAAAVAALSLAGCGGSNGGDPADERPPAAGATEVRLVDCADWRAADAGRRREIVAAVREFAGGESGSPGGHGATLDDAEAVRLFDSYCGQEFATGFKLYKLYTRAASFRAP
jgi:hypothetical protein